MPSERYAGATPTAADDHATRLSMAAQTGAVTPNRISVASEITTAALTKASKTYVDTQDAQFVAPNYFQTQDALNIPNTALGTAAEAPITGTSYGVATTDANNHIPLAQFPAIGEGFLVGPWGPTAVFAAAGVTTTPVKIADWNIGVQSVTFQPMVFANIMATSSNFGRPVIEIRMSNGQQSYSFQTLVAMGFGRSNYNDEQAVTVWPAPGNPGQSGGSNFAPTYNIWMSAWLYDPTGNGVSVDTQSIVSGAAFLLRTAQ